MRWQKVLNMYENVHENYFSFNNFKENAQSTSLFRERHAKDVCNKTEYTRI